MVCKLMSTSRKASGFLLAEALVAIGITSLLVLAICAFTMFSGHSFAALFNYVDLDDCNRICMDQLSRDVRQANYVDSFSTISVSGQVITNKVVLDVPNGAGSAKLSYEWLPSTRNLTRTSSSDNIAKVVLHDCDRLNFDVRQRNPVGGSYDVYPVATPGTAKVVDVSWLCSRTIFGRKENTESVQTARIVIRKQGT